MADYGLVLTEDDLWAYRGHSLPLIIAAFSESSGINLLYTPIEQAMNQRQHVSRQSLAEQGLPDGLIGFVREAHAGGAALAVGSSNTLANIRGFLDQTELATTFDAFVTCDDTDRHKPDPTPFLLAAERLGIPPARCVVIEDAEAGIDAAHRAGMLAIGYTGYLRNSNEPLLPHADLHIDSFTHLSIERLRALVRRDGRQFKPDRAA